MIYHSSCDWWRNIILFDVLRIKELTTNPDIILWNSTYVNVTRVSHNFALIIIRVRLVEIDSLVRGTKVTFSILYLHSSLSRLFTFPLYYCFIYICACSLRNSRRWVREGREARTDLSTTTYTAVCAIRSPLICGCKRHDRQIRRIISKGRNRILRDFERRTFRCSTACVQPAGHIFREQLPLQPAGERRWKGGRSDCPHSWWQVFRKTTQRRRRKNTSPRQLFIVVCGTS